MEFVAMLWLPILATGIVVFIGSAIVWTAMPHHKKEWGRLPNEAALMNVLRSAKVSSGLYAFPAALADESLRNDPAAQAEAKQGPIGYLTLHAGGMPSMGPMMMQSVVYNIIVAFFVAYTTSHTVTTGAEYLTVFRVAGTVSFMAYALGTVHEHIWFSKPWKSYWLHALDSLFYGALTGGIFGWLWPR